MSMLALLLATGLAFADTEAAEAPATAPTEEAEPPRLVQITASLTLRVDDRQAALETAVAKAKSKGGWFSSLSESQVTVRVPTEDMEPLIEELRAEGDVVERSFDTSDLTAQREEVATRLKSRQELLARYMAVLEDAHADAVVNVEREITRAIAEIESLQGQLRVLDDRGTYGQLTVRFQYRSRKAPINDGNSSFAWLNRMNMADLLWDLENGVRDTRSILGATAPEGFAPYRKPGRFQAVSPDDVLYRVRSDKNKPEAELDFWKEALRTRMVAAGYRVEAESDISTVSGREGYLLELGAANGAVDQAYVVALFVVGKKLVIAEATGEAETFKARRDAIVEAMKALEG